jgi:membrane associated rhomboid family serine protease
VAVGSLVAAVSHHRNGQGSSNGNGDRDSKEEAFGIKDVVLYSIVALNCLIYLSWKFARYEFVKNNEPATLVFMLKHFFNHEYSLQDGRPWTLLTSCVSQKEESHLMFNMMSLLFTAPAILAIVGPVTFLGLYFGAGVVSNVVSIGWKKYMNPWIDRMDKNVVGYPPNHGASGEQCKQRNKGHLMRQ